mgnify:FL=1
MAARSWALGVLALVLAGCSLNRPSQLGEEARQALVPLLEGLHFPWTRSHKPFKPSLVTPALKYIRVCLDEWDQQTERGDRLLAELLGQRPTLAQLRHIRTCRNGFVEIIQTSTTAIQAHPTSEASPAPATSVVPGIH